MTLWIPGKLAHKKYWNDSLFSLHIDVETPVVFEAGQFTRIALDIDGKRIARPYSFVNTPFEAQLEFYLITVPGGELTQPMALVEPGETIWVQTRPAGFFTMPEVPAGKVLWMIASGTALGVFLSLLKTTVPWARFEKIVLVHAVRTLDSLTHQDLIQTFSEKNPGQFQFIPFVSRDAVLPAGVLPGRVTTAIETGLLEQIVGEPLLPETAQVMICGNPDLVKDMMTLLQNKGLKKHLRRDPGQITIENYWKD
jgi:ferredoxin--NADP+ reductase